MTRVAILAALALAGCGDNLSDPAVAACERAASQWCASIGYDGNRACYLALAQDCSPDDESEAIALCWELRGENPDATVECRLQWR